MRLALSLGCTRRELLNRMDSAELVMWEAFYRVEPFGPIALNKNFAILIAALVNSLTSNRIKPVDISLGDITERPQVVQDAESIKAILMGLVDHTKPKQ